MSNFKIGDRIEFTIDDIDEFGKIVWKIGTIVHFTTNIVRAKIYVIAKDQKKYYIKESGIRHIPIPIKEVSWDE